jgi:hypothetical protein
MDLFTHNRPKRPYGHRALVLEQPEPVPFIGAAGELGMFPWNPNFSQPTPPAKWMLPKGDEPAPARVSNAKPSPQAELFRDGLS